MINEHFFVLLLILIVNITQAQERSNHGRKFEQLDNMLRSPNEYRGADGAPGPRYWQQKADYKIKCTLDTKTQRIDGSEVITYHNNSPVEMTYLWLQLDENEHSPKSSKHYMNGSKMREIMDQGSIDRLEAVTQLDKYGVNTESTVQELVRHFGQEIAEIVIEVSDDMALPKAARKEQQIDHAPHISRRAKLVKLADKICNLRDIAHSPPHDWSLQRRQAYFDWAKAVIDQLRGVHPALEHVFDQAYRERPSGE